MVYQLDFSITRSGDELAPYVLRYDREHQICNGSGTLSVELTPNSPFTIIQGDQLIVKEDGTTVGKYYVEQRERADKEDKTTAKCVDGSKWLKDYFIDDRIETDLIHRAQHWAEIIIEKTGVSYSFNTSNQGIKVEAIMDLGLQSAYDALTTICQQNGWFFYFNASGTLIIDNITFIPSNFTSTVGHTDAISITTRVNDERVRNRAVIWGGTDVQNKEWIFTERFVKTPWARNSHDFRTVAVSNGAIGTKNIANEMAKKLLDEYAFPEYKKEIEVIGFRNPILGEGVRVQHDFYSGVGMITSYRVDANPRVGAVTTLVLDERCPRLFAYWKPWDLFELEYEPYYFGEYVYIATEGNGVWRKELLSGSTWENFSDGLGGLYVRDLYVSYGVMVCIVDNAINPNGIVYARTVGDSSWRVFNPTDISDATAPFDGPILSTDLDAKACIINQVTNEIEVIYNHVNRARCWHVVVKPFSGGKHVVRQVWSVDKDDSTIIYYNWTGIDIDTNDLDTFILGNQGGTSYPLTDGTEAEDDVTTFWVGDTWNRSSGAWSNYHARTRSLGEHTMQGTSKLNVWTMPEPTTGYSYGQYFGYMYDGTYIAVPTYARSGGSNVQTLTRFNTITEKEETVTLISGGGDAQASFPGDLFSGAGVQQIGVGKYIYVRHTSADAGSEPAEIWMYDFADASNVLLFTATGDCNVAGPFVILSQLNTITDGTMKEARIIFITEDNNGSVITDMNVHVWDVEAATLTTSNPLTFPDDFETDLSANPGPYSSYGLGGLEPYPNAYDFSDEHFFYAIGGVYSSGTTANAILLTINGDDGTVSAINHDLDSQYEHGGGDCLAVYDPVEDLFYWGVWSIEDLSPDPNHSGIHPTMSVTQDLTTVTEENNDTYFDTNLDYGFRIYGRGFNTMYSDFNWGLFNVKDGLAASFDDGFYDDLGSWGQISVTLDSVNALEHFNEDEHNDRLYSMGTPTDEGDYYKMALKFKTSNVPTTLTQINTRLSKNVHQQNFRPFIFIGNALFFWHDNHGDADMIPTALYPDTGDIQLLRTNPNINFETVFYADRDGNRDNIVGVEISKPNPIILHGSMTQTDSRLPDYTKGIIYRSDFGNTSAIGLGSEDNWLYNVFNEYGHTNVNAARFFDVFGSATTSAGSGLIIDPSILKEEPNRYMLLTQNDGRLLYKAHDNFLGNASLQATFVDPVGQVETNNGSFAPHIFVATSGVVPKFYQRLNTQSQFFQESTGLPGSRIKKIRVDDYF